MERLYRIVRKIAIGIYVLKYGRVPKSGSINPVDIFPYDDELRPPVPLVAATYTERFLPKRWTRVQPGIFSYIIVRDPTDWGRLCCIMDFYETAWGVAMFPQPTRWSKQQHRVAREQLDLLNELTAIYPRKRPSV
jgi:hypothetical protein